MIILDHIFNDLKHLCPQTTAASPTLTTSVKRRRRRSRWPDNTMWEAGRGTAGLRLGWVAIIRAEGSGKGSRGWQILLYLPYVLQYGLTNL